MEFQCPHCGISMTSEDANAGEVVACAACSSSNSIVSPRAGPFGDPRPQLHSGKRRFNRVRGPDVLPMGPWKVKVREKPRHIGEQGFDGLGYFVS